MSNIVVTLVSIGYDSLITATIYTAQLSWLTTLFTKSTVKAFSNNNHSSSHIWLAKSPITLYMGAIKYIPMDIKQNGYFENKYLKIYLRTKTTMARLVP